MFHSESVVCLPVFKRLRESISSDIPSSHLYKDISSHWKKAKHAETHYSGLRFISGGLSSAE